MRSGPIGFLGVNMATEYEGVILDGVAVSSTVNVTQLTEAATNSIEIPDFF
jgi:hypothetical protein